MKEDRIFIRNGRRSHRRRYSLAEPRAGLAILGLLALVVAWVGWKGAHPDPELFAAGDDLLQGGAPPVQRGPLPTDLAADGWTEGSVSRFDSSNLYEKIDGREGYYKRFGFRQLYFVSLTGDSDASRSVDVEMYDLGETANALGAYAGERDESISPRVTDAGLSHISRNALYVTRGPYYVRAIGSDESPATVAQLEHMLAVIDRSLEGEPLPWAYALFAGRLGLDPGSVSYMAEDAFSFSFAKEVYAAALPDGETEMFVVASTDAGAAQALAAQFATGFLDYGKQAGRSGGTVWVADRYIGSVSGATHSGAWVVGVRGAPDVDAAQAALSELLAALADLPRPEATT